MTIKISKGYVTEAQCNKYHSGNRRLVPAHGYYECQGCGHFHTRESVIRAIESGDEYTGAGGVAARRLPPHTA